MRRDSTPIGRVGLVLFAAYAWTAFLAAGFLALSLLLIPQPPERRRALAHAVARTVLRLTGMRLDTTALARLPARCIVVANHSSYIDGVILMAALPPRFSFVIKREMSRVPFAGALLRRIGSEFVERRDHERGARDARRLVRLAEQGQPLVFFPEGTFGPRSGLLAFHIGAFAAACRSGLPVLPVAIRGARARLPPGSVLPRPGTIQVRALSPLSPLGRGRRAAAALRDAARAALLAELGEPDLQSREYTADAVGVER